MALDHSICAASQAHGQLGPPASPACPALLTMLPPTCAPQVILVRLETSPEDVGGMHAAQGILTARGGMTSHAAVVARGWGKPCVCGLDKLQVGSWGCGWVLVCVFGAPVGREQEAF